MRRIVCALALSLAASSLPAQQTPLERRITALLADPRVAHDHWGIAATTLDGQAIVSINDRQLFHPESNTKLFTTAAALAILGPRSTTHTVVVSDGVLSPTLLEGSLILRGGGEPNLNGLALPYDPTHGETPIAPPLRYLEQLADSIAATGLTHVTGDLIGDDTLFPHEPYGTSWAVDDLVWGYGAPASALTFNDNQLRVTVAPTTAGQPAGITVEPALPYYTILNTVVTVAAKQPASVQFERDLGSKTLRIFGTIAAGAKPDIEQIAIHDPAEYAALALKSMLEARSIRIDGVARAQHRTSQDSRSFQAEAREPLPVRSAVVDSITPTTGVLASHTSEPLAQDITLTNKVSQNLHAELLLHQLGLHAGSDGSAVQGVRVVRAFALRAGVAPEDLVLFDGSGLSAHNLTTPRAITQLLRYAQTQPWGALYKSSLPIAGVDGTLSNRFLKSPLKGRVQAKTGTDTENRALSGYLTAASGATLVFAILSSDHAPGSAAEREVIDRIVEAIAEAN